jgi:hypothetical protein
MKIMLSMPRTISNAVNVPSAIHISGFASHSSIDSSLAYVIHTVGLFPIKEYWHGEENVAISEASQARDWSHHGARMHRELAVKSPAR